MELFSCPACGSPLYFRNLACACGAGLAFDPEPRRFAPLADGEACANRAAIDCNWRAEGRLCRACAMTRTTPQLGVDDNDLLWREAEEAKRWVLANLMRWGLFREADRRPRPIFDMLSEETAAGETRVMMGHADGVVTINVAEADPSVREARRMEMAERYRTMTGHFRHELGHFVLERLLTLPEFAGPFRALFGDERADYAAALKRHYADGPPADHAKRHLTAYASAHPHEDWAETFAHHLHLVDMTDSAAHGGLSSAALEAAGGGAFDAYAAPDAATLLGVAVELGLAINHVNRAMGMHDVYPFVLTPTTREKLGFVHAWIGRAA